MQHRIETIAEGVTVHLGDCRDVLPTLGAFDVALTILQQELNPPVFNVPSGFMTADEIANAGGNIKHS